MKNKKVLAIIAIVAIIGFSMVTCSKNKGHSGQLTITGLSAYNDKYVFAQTDDEDIMAVANFNDKSEKCCRMIVLYKF